MTEILTWAAAFVVGALATGRLARLIVHDTFPPVAWLRAKWDGLTEDSGWNELLHCHFCAAIWLSAGTVAWYALGAFLWEPLLWAWWAVMSWLALSYVAAIVVERDSDD